MRKFLLTLATVFVASWAMAQEAQDYPVVTSVEELASYPDSTMVLFENIELVMTEEDMGYYVKKTPCLSDGTTQISGDIPYSGIPACFSAIGFVHTVYNSWDETSYREFYVEKMSSVSGFNTLAEMVNFCQGEAYYDIVANSDVIKVKEGEAVVTYIDGDYIFFYTNLATGSYNETLYGVMNYPDAEEQFRIGNVLEGWFGLGVKFQGTYTPTLKEYDNEYHLISHKGGCFTIDVSTGGYIYPLNNIEPKYASTDIESINDGYLYEAGAYRFPLGFLLTEKDGKYYLSTEYTYEDYVDKGDGNWGWVDVTETVNIETASNYIDLSEYVGTTLTDYIAGVWDYANLGNTDRFLIAKFISQVEKYEDIASFLSKGEQEEDEIITEFTNPLMVTYVYNDDAYKFRIIVADQTGALALDFSNAICHDDDYTPPTDERKAAYEALKNIKAGDMISGVKGLAQFVVANTAPTLVCSVEEWDSSIGDWGGYAYTTYVPTVVSSGEVVKSTMTVTIEDMLNEWSDCQNNSSMPKIANRVVSLIDVQVIDSTVWNENIKFLVQGTDTMELSNLWGERGMNFQVFERNNIVGIADYYTINSNGIYQIMPLSQEHITDATLIPEVENIEDLADYAGLPVILKNAEISAIVEGFFASYYLQDGATQVMGLTANGRFDLQGIYEETEYGNTFTVYSVVNVHSLATISDIDRYVNAFPEAADQAYIVDKEVVVTYVDGENVFIQYEGLNDFGQTMTIYNMLTGVKANVKIGDAITGLKGVSTPIDSGMDEDWNPYLNCGAYFTVAEDANITVVSSDNEIKYSGTQQVSYIVGYNEANYSAQALMLYGGGKILKEEGKYYYEETMVDEKDGKTTTTRVEVASNVINLDEYVDQTISSEEFILGVYNVGNTTADARIFYITGFMSNVIEYATIADFYAGGEIDASFTIKFTNPLTVTYVYHDEYGSGKVFVQDATGGLRIDFYTTEAIQHIKIGDQIIDAHGMCHYMSFYGMMYLGGYDSNFKDYTFEVNGNAVPVVREVTIPELNAEAEIANKGTTIVTEFVSDLVTLKNVTYEVTTILDNWGDEVPVAYLIDEDGNKFVMPGLGSASFESRGLTTYEKMNVTGVIDNGGLNYNAESRYSLYPRSQEDIQDALGVNTVEVEGGIYLDATNQVVANGAVAIVVYDINGRTVAAANAETVNANGLAQGVYVVRATYADGTVATAKVVR